MSLYDREGEHTHAERAAASLAHTDAIRELARSLVEEITGHSFDRHSHCLYVNLEDGFQRAIFDSYLPTRAQFEQDAAEDEAFNGGLAA